MVRRKGTGRGQQIAGDTGDLDVPVVQGVARREVHEGGGGGDAPREEDAAIAGVTDAPAAGGAGEEGEAEVNGLRDGARGGSGPVRRLGLVEPSPAPVLEEPEQGRRVEAGLEEPAEEAAPAGNAAEGGAYGGGAREVGWGGEAEEYVLQYLVGEGRLPPGRRHRAGGRAVRWERWARSESDWDWTVE